MDSHKSIFSLLNWNMRAYAISWVTTFLSSIVNVVWSVYVFHFDFVSNIDGALASQIGVVVLNELYLVWSIFVSRKYLFGIGAPVNMVWLSLTAAFICLLIYAPMMAFGAFASLTGVTISGHSPLYDAIGNASNGLLAWVLDRSRIDLGAVRGYAVLFRRGMGTLSVVVGLFYLRAFFRRKAARP